MRCLSLKQPFAELVVTGRKTIELRTWSTSFRGVFLVHASGNFDSEACELFKMNPSSLPKRAIVGKATLYDIKEYNSEEEFLQDRDKHLATEKYFGSGYGFLLKDPVKFDKPIPMPGNLGFFEAHVKVP
ncbi:MAG: ASCH domain-containing protein [Candidatus Micrarchaeota archaeon]|nr:ASCH domain-containing protein [Candidatus Micrarchaeota archaeon]